MTHPQIVITSLGTAAPLRLTPPAHWTAQDMQEFQTMAYPAWCTKGLRGLVDHEVLMMELLEESEPRAICEELSDTIQQLAAERDWQATRAA